MRTSFVLGLVSVLALSSFAVACQQTTGNDSELAQRKADQGDDDDDTGSSTTGALPNGAGNDPSTEGSTNPGTSNPNATSAPPAPTTTPTASSAFALAVDNATPTSDIGDSTTVNVTVTPSNGFTGAVAISVTGLPTGVTADPNASANITGATAVTVPVKLSAGFGAPATAPGAMSALTFTGTAGSNTATAPVNFKVNPHVVMTIPVNVAMIAAANTQLRAEWGDAFGPNGTTLLTQTTGNPIIVNVFNADSTKHIVHATNTFGGHGSTTAGQEVMPNAYELDFSAGAQPNAKRNRALNPVSATQALSAQGYAHDVASNKGGGFDVKVGTAPSN